jgi:predicted LPLAT superfamily acyltransferase
MSNKPDWSDKEERGSSVFFELCIRLYRWGGWWLIRPLLYPIVTYFFITDPDRRQHVWDYLEHLASTEEGKEALNGEPGTSDVYQIFLNFGRVTFDRVSLWMGVTEPYDITFRNREVLKPYLDSNQGVILLSFHVGSFGLMRFGALSKSLNMHILAYWEQSERVNQILKQADPDSQLNIIDLDPGSPDSMLEVKDKVDRGDFIGMLGDRKSVGSTERTSYVPFLGEPAGFPQGPYLMSYFLDCPIFLIYCLRTGSRQYEIQAEKFSDGIDLPRDRREERLAEHVNRYADCLEDVCYEAPHQWFNFFDFWERD